MLPIHKILHPTDFSEYSNYAYGLARTVARECRAQIVILHVTTPPGDEKGDEALRQRLRDEFPDEPGFPLEARLVHGTPSEEILRAADETRCDLIVMGTHGRTGPCRARMGSVAESVLRRATCPILAAKSWRYAWPPTELTDTPPALGLGADGPNAQSAQAAGAGNVVEMEGVSRDSWEDAARQIVGRNAQAGRRVTRIDVVQNTALVLDNKITEYRVTAKVALEAESESIFR